MSRVKSIVVIGAGIAGLSTGCYAQMNGYRTQIFELHSTPGGLCTAWKRKGYVFDGCLHHLAGAGPDSRLYRLWEELGAVQDHPTIDREYFVQVEDPSGKRFTVYTDVDRLEQHMKDLAPADAQVVDAYVRGVRLLFHTEVLALAMASAWDVVKLLPWLPGMLKWMRITMDQFAQRFSDPFVRRAFPVIQYDFPGVPMLIHLNFIASCHQRTLGWPSGGSLPFAQSIAKRFEDLGGELHCRSRVAKILVSDDRAVGVRLADGTEHHADVVISAADGHTTVFDMLDGRYVDDQIRAYYDQVPDRQDMNFHVSLGVARDMSGEPHALTFFLEKPVNILGKERDRLSVEIPHFDPSFAPPGKAAVKVLLDASYATWKELYADRERYDAEKQRVAEAVIEQLAVRFPGLKEQVEVVDVATPVTIERFTGNWHGLQAWMDPGAGPLDMFTGVGKTLPGLDAFFQIGHWAGGIGLSTGAIGGRKLVRRLCKQDRRPFVTSTP
jgi:phytoene dehydrogenase-like protein